MERPVTFRLEVAIFAGNLTGRAAARFPDQIVLDNSFRQPRPEPCKVISMFCSAPDRRVFKTELAFLSCWGIRNPIQNYCQTTVRAAQIAKCG